MTEKNTTAAHTRARGKTTHAKPGGRTTARAGAGTGIERKKTPAKAAQKPREATERRPGDAGAPGSAPSTMREVASLEQQARHVVEKDVKHLLRGLKAKARKGSASDVKLLMNLARIAEQQQPAAKPDDESRMAMLHRLSSEPEYNEAQDGGSAGDSQPVDLQPDDAAAENPSEIEKEIA